MMSFMNTWMISSSVTLGILIFSKNMGDHEFHVCMVLENLQEIRFYTKLEKCEFHQSKVEFLGYIISRDGIHMDPCKVRIIVD
jgi:hypothetical protein